MRFWYNWLIWLTMYGLCQRNADTANNRLVGFNIELMERFGAFSNRKIQYLDMEFGSQIAALAGRKLDLVATPLAINEERKQRVAFSDAYYIH